MLTTFPQKYTASSNENSNEQTDSTPQKKRKRTASGAGPGSTPDQDQDANNAVMHAQMYSMGDKYAIQDLKTYALAQFKVAIASQKGAPLAQSIAEAYTSTPDNDRGLRDVVLDVTQASAYTLTVEDSDFQTLACDIPLFGFELLQATMRSVG